MTNKKTILMVAAENDALPNAKVGGIGDVVRDLPLALAEQGCIVHCVLPSYGYLHELPGATLIAQFPIQFGEGMEQVRLFQLPLSASKLSSPWAEAEDPGVCYWLVDHPAMYPCGVGQLYCNDGSDRPFATDASKYALFCAAVGQAMLNHSFGRLDVLHLHDWHSAMLLVLREYDPHYAPLKSIRTVYTIHNLSLQGVRPLQGDPSSLRAWFPYLSYDRATICDPRASDCINPMRAGVHLADKVHAVSPTYAQEIQKPSQPDSYIYGGEGLEVDLVTAAKQGRLVGILNGCEYPELAQTKVFKTRMVRLIQDALVAWVSRSANVASAHWLAEQRLRAWEQKKERGFVVTSVGRITEQKARLLREPIEYAQVRQPVLAHLLESLGEQGTLILLGSGDPSYEQFFTEMSGKFNNLIFLKGYSDPLAQALYQFGDLFLMPSSFEPCGISQMLAMRAGQPCLVHGVGGLNDTVIDGVSGFSFSGADGTEQGYNLLKRFEDVLTLAKLDAKKLQTIGKAAAKARFTWQSVAQEYLATLYSDVAN